MTNRTAALRYARALLDVARSEQRDLQAIETELAGFVDLFRAHPELERVLTNPAIAAPKKRAAVVELARLATLSPILAKLVALLAERDRLVLMPDLLAAYRERLQDYLKIVRATVATPTPLVSGQAERITNALARATGRTVMLTAEVDPALIGGLVARLGSTVYDASLTTQLQKMKARLAERA